MRTEQLTKCFHKLRAMLGSRLNGLTLVIFYITDRYKAIFLNCFSVFACFGVSFHTVLPSMCLDDI